MNQDTARTSARPGAGRALFAAIVGTVIEWYDYALYGTAAGLMIGPLFFAGSSAGASLAAFATFAVGFVARPLGGVLVGHVGDRHGRRPAMLLTVVLMGVATVGTGLLPIHLAIGAAAPVLLVLLQGMGAGAELAGAMTLVAEFAPPRRRGLYTSLVLFAPPAGIVLASVAFLWAASQGDDALLAWAWRVPFLASAVLFALAVFIRAKLEESPEYEAALARARQQGQGRKVPLLQLLRHHTRAVLAGFFALTGHNALNYILAVFSLSFMTSPAVGMPRGSALLAVSIGSVCGVLTTPLGGGLAADRFGARPVLAVGSLLGALGAFPLFRALASGDTVLATVAIGVGYGLVVACTSGAQGAFLAGLFPIAERFSGIALARETNGAVVAGFSPLVAAALITASGGATWGAATFLAACCLSSVLAVALMRSEHHA
ncbi:MFS transporter [Kocuria rhizophila]|uniref:MFS transporter n=1 Tax=Kocuria rhizophila TaxID=72000 RepID=UPI001D521BA1|nr:MFS transporter [Kocuria rhizophila]MCC5674026.1 MFS transporter [Kocuria rhizophila]